MDSVVSKTNCGSSSLKKLDKLKRKNADAVPHCDMYRNNLSADNELASQAQGRDKNKKLKMKDSSEEVDIVESSEDVLTMKKKRKKSKGAEEVHTSELSMIRKGPNVHDSSSKKTKKKLVEKSKSFVEIPGELMTHECTNSRQNKEKHSDKNLGPGDDSSYKVDFGFRETKGMKRKLNVVKESVETSEKNYDHNLSVQKLCKSAGKKKKRKLKNLNSQEEMNSREKCDMDILSEISDSMKRKVKRKSGIDPLLDSNISGSVKVKKPDDESSLQKKKVINDLSFSNTNSGSVRIKGELVKVDLSSKKKKRGHRNNICAQNETDTKQKVHKKIPPQGNFSLETDKLDLKPRISSAVEKDTIIHLDDCSGKQRKEKEYGGKVLGSENCEVNRSDDSGSVYQKEVVDKLWEKIKCRIESRIQLNKKNKKSKAVSELKEEFQAQNESDDNEGDWHSIVFKFDNDPCVRHYIPKKVMALNGIRLQWNEMTSINLKIPTTYFRGSSLDSILGYGYNT